MKETEGNHRVRDVNDDDDDGWELVNFELGK